MCRSSKKNEKDVEMLKTLMSLKTMDTRRSTTGYLFKLNGNITSRKSQRQSTFSLSSTEGSREYGFICCNSRSNSTKAIVERIQDLSRGNRIDSSRQPRSHCVGQESCLSSKSQAYRHPISLCARNDWNKAVDICFTLTCEMHAAFLTLNLPRPKFECDIKAFKLLQDRQGKVLKPSDSFK